MESWVNKTKITKITTMRTQTQDTKTIHPKQRKGILIPRNKLHTQWEIRNHAAQEHAQQQIQEKAKKKLRNTLKRREKRNNSTGSQTSRDAKRNGDEQRRLETISRTNARIPDRTRRPRRGGREEENRRYYTCVRCIKPFKTPTGETIHPKHSPECRQVHQREVSESKCDEYRRDFRWPSELREHRRYVCADQSRGATDLENPHQANAHQETEIDREQQKRQGPEEEKAKQTHAMKQIYQEQKWETPDMHTYQVIREYQENPEKTAKEH